MKFQRTILKQEVARKLFPSSVSIKSAMQSLREEIRLSPTFEKELANLASKKRAHHYTHKQLELILEHFCVTKEEFDQL